MTVRNTCTFAVRGGACVCYLTLVFETHSEPDFELCNQMFARFLEAGLNYFDTARAYLGGKSEVALRESLVRRHPRDSQALGWLGWAKDGETAGTTGLSKRAEAIDVQVLPKGQAPAGYDAPKAACLSR